MSWEFYTASGTQKTNQNLGSEFPIGTIVDYAGLAAPANWLLCDGSAVSRTTYSELFNVVGTYYGAGNGTTTFNLPDSTGQIIYFQRGPAAYTYANNFSAPTFVSTLPVSPFDGQEVYYQSTTAGTGGGTTDSMASIGAIWHLRYRASSSSAYKWEFLGGATIFHHIDTFESLGAGTATYSDLSTVGPRIKAPLAGEYSVLIGAGFKHNTNGGVAYMSYAAGATTAGSAEEINLQYNWPNFVANNTGVQATRRSIKAIAAGGEFIAKYKNNDPAPPATASFDKRRMEIVPIRVG